VNFSKLNPKSNVESPFPNALGKGRGWGKKAAFSQFSLLTWTYFCEPARDVRADEMKNSLMRLPVKSS